MLNTIVCEKVGCSGNRFKISVQRLRVLLICTECRDIIKFNREANSIVPTICSKCNEEIFKVSKDIKSEHIWFNCIECGHRFKFNPKNT